MLKTATSAKPSRLKSSLVTETGCSTGISPRPGTAWPATEPCESTSTTLAIRDSGGIWDTSSPSASQEVRCGIHSPNRERRRRLRATQEEELKSVDWVGNIYAPVVVGVSRIRA